MAYLDPEHDIHTQFPIHFLPCLASFGTKHIVLYRFEIPLEEKVSRKPFFQSEEIFPILQCVDATMTLHKSYGYDYSNLPYNTGAPIEILIEGFLNSASMEFSNILRGFYQIF